MKRSEALSLGLSHYNTGTACKHGHISARRVNDRVCMACDRVSKKEYAITNHEHLMGLKKVSYERNKKHSLAQKRSYRQANKGAVNALVAKRKVHIKQATPSWVDSEELWFIKEVYLLAALRTKMFGFSWHVDHIVPLQGKLVSGLHVPENMRVIPAIENIKKKNKFEVHNGF